MPQVNCQCAFHPECKPTSENLCLMTAQEKAFDFGAIYQEFETPDITEQLIDLYKPILEQNFIRFLLAVYHANESPGLTEGQRVKLFQYFYKPLEINYLEGIKFETEKNQTPAEVKWVEI